MTNDARTKIAKMAVLSQRRPLLLIVLAVALFGAAFFLNPDALISLGPFRKSLTSDNELTRNTAELTLTGLRVLCGIAGILLGAALTFWPRFVASAPMQALASHAVPEREIRFLGTIRNRSFAVAIVMCIGWFAYVALSPAWVDYDMRRWISSENGIVERGTALLFLASSITAFVSVRRMRRNRALYHTRRVVWLGLLGLFFFLCFGEEISWGQRIFGIETLDLMKGVNVQNENNLHNLAGYFADHAFIAGVFLYGTVLPLLAGRVVFWRRALRWLGLPIASMGLAIGFAVASGIHDWTLYWVLPETELRAAELRELLTGVCFFLLTLESLKVASFAKADPEAKASSSVA
ncbi:MAG: hypothetical protein ACI91B_000536 [Planctomycetota bacterium]|jgi:hypothetical protein